MDPIGLGQYTADGVLLGDTKVSARKAVEPVVKSFICRCTEL
jgi:hypothetical protein